MPLLHLHEESILLITLIYTPQLYSMLQSVCIFYQHLPGTYVCSVPWCLLLKTLGGEYGVRVVVVVLYARDCSVCTPIFWQMGPDAMKGDIYAL